MANGQISGPPAVDFYSMLSGLGDTLQQNAALKRKAAIDESRKAAFSDFTALDPSSADYGKQAMTIAQRLGSAGDQEGAVRFLGLAQTAASKAADDAWRREESARAQRNADRSFGLQERAAARADDRTPAGFEVNPGGGYRPIQGGPADPGYIARKSSADGESTITAQVEQRRRAAEAVGLKPDHPAYNGFLLTGKMPREDTQPLTAGDKEAIRTADEAILGNRAAIESLNRAKALSKSAFAGPYAGGRGYAASFLGETSDTGKKGIATENLTNEVMTNALGQLKAIFGGNPTEGERKILLDLQGSVNKPDIVRQAIFDRAIAVAQKKLEFNQSRADELRGGSYYKSKQPGSPAPSNAGASPVDWRTYFGGGQ